MGDELWELNRQNLPVSCNILELYYKSDNATRESLAPTHRQIGSDHLTAA